MDQRSDVYRLSVLVHELLTLHHTLDGIEDLEVLDRLQQRAEGHLPVQCPVRFTEHAANQAAKTLLQSEISIASGMIRRPHARRETR